ncbi:MAG: hypothetical protein IKR52_01195 [Paludibacteraceae bacterium]|nr:hypothetical protein [Paludibacteraceae bacterium]
MKKILLFAVASFCADVACMGQFNVVSDDNIKDMIIVKGNGNIVEKGRDGYYLIATGNTSVESFKLFLGKERDEAVKAIQFLVDWEDRAENKAFLEIEQNGVIFTLYKYTSNFFLITDGDREFCRMYIKQMRISTAVSALGGNDDGGYRARNGQNHQVGNVCCNLLRRALSKM